MRELYNRMRRAVAQASRRKRGWRFLFVAVADLVLMILAGRVVWIGWRTVSSESNVTCQVAFQPLRDRNNGYIEFFLEKEELLEPIFDGGFFINLTDAYGKDPVRLKVTTTGARDYGSSTSFVDLRWDALNQVLWMNDKVNMGFISQTNSHRMFPFDSAHFDYTLNIEPAVSIPVFRFTERVPGFVMPCNAANVSRQGDGSFHVAFELRRSLFIPVTASVLFLAAVVFCIAIATSLETKALPTAVASFFFSLWSIRGVFGLEAQGFPTLFDVGILVLCLLILSLLFIRFTLHLFRQHNIQTSASNTAK